MGKYNYKGEEYFDTSIKLFKQLDKISKTLVSNLKSENHSYKVSDIIKAEKFNDLWEVSPNKHNNPHSRNEYKGIYAFGNIVNGSVDFKYIGISQTIRRRFTRGHVKGKKRHDGSFANIIIKNKFPELDLNSRENKLAEYQKKCIYPLRFTFVPIDDNMLMHIAEVYCVNKLQAHWNTFETH